MRQREKKRLGEEREAQAHRSGRNHAVMPAEVRHSDERFLCSGGVSGGGAKERSERRSGGFIGVRWRGGGARV
jgi:hypothetical protein